MTDTYDEGLLIERTMDPILRQAAEIGRAITELECKRAKANQIYQRRISDLRVQQHNYIKLWAEQNYGEDSEECEG